MMRHIPLSSAHTLLLCAAAIGAGAASLVRANGQTVAIPSWDLQSTEKTGSDLASVSRVGRIDATSWYHVDHPFCTLVGCLIDSGVYNATDLFFSDNLKQLAGGQFEVAWLYRAEFDLEPGRHGGKHYFLITHGISSRADIYLNGNHVADKSVQAGAYAGRRYEITDILSERNALVVCVYPTSYHLDLAVGWADWNNAPADHGTGVWRPVELKQTGPVELGTLRVVTQLGTPVGSGPASVTLKATARNLENVSVTISASAVVSPISGSGQAVSWKKTYTLGPSSTTDIVLGGTVDSPAIWWPRQWGDQPLYAANVTVVTVADGEVSDSAAATFGFRTVSSNRSTSFGDTTFYINGNPFQVLGGGYAPDLYLRFDAVKLQRELQYLLDLGLNTIRLEGKNEHPELYEITDRMGIMVMPGWECCDKWEAWSYNPVKDALSLTPTWSDDDYVIANASMRHEASMMQTHPSVLTYLIGSDYWPDPKATSLYVEGFKTVDWQNPITVSASSRGADAESGLGPSGLRMEGPYDWVPPSYWWDCDEGLYGSAAGFGSELSAGGGTPDLPSLVKFLSHSDLQDLWTEPDKNIRFHMGSDASSFRNRTIFNRGLWRRYGAPISLEDYVQKAQMSDYEVTRAQFEAYASMWSNPKRPATGLIYWMLTGALPKLHWNLWDYYMRPSGNYFGAKKGSQVEHVAYDYVRQTVWLTNRSLGRSGSRRVDLQIIDTAGKVLHGDTFDVSTSPNSSKNIRSLSSVLKAHGDEKLVFLKLVLADGDTVLSRNVYWLSPGTTDKLAWDKSDWRHTPVAEFSGFTKLNELPSATVDVKVAWEGDNMPAADGETPQRRAVVTLENLTTAPAFFISLSLVDAHGQEVLPLTWSDNYVTLWPRETLALTAQPLKGTVGTPVAVLLWGKNVAKGRADIPQDSGSAGNKDLSRGLGVLVVLFTATLMWFSSSRRGFE